MKRRLKGLFLVCITCIILAGCGSDKLTIPVDSVTEIAESYDFVPIHDSITMFYSTTNNNQVCIANYYKNSRNNLTVDISILKIDGKSVYYDTENDCFTTEPIQNN